MRDQDELDRIGRALAAEPDPERVLTLLLSEARRLTHAEAGTVYLRRGDQLHLAVVQNDVLARRVGEDELQRRLQLAPLGLKESSIAGYVALARGSVNLPDVYKIPLERPYAFDPRMDAKHGYRTRSMLAMPVRDGRGAVFGVLQLINALNDVGEVVPFDQEREDFVAALLTHIARVTPASKPKRPQGG
jgi:putative two-component system response regulator